MEMIMNKLVISALLAAALVSPAAAQSYDPDLGTGNITPPVYAQAGHAAHPALVRGANQDSFAAYARVGGAVMPDGAVARDPDPNIQFQLNREAQQGEW
jgi:hypothetical protein